MTEDRFKNRKEALAWLQSKGQISAGKFYQDCEAGKITIAADKTVSKFQVAEYADRLFNQYKQAPKSLDMEDRKRGLEIEKLEQEVEKGRLANRKEDANWLYKEDAWAQMAALIGTLRDALRHQFHIGTTAIIHSSGGDQARGPEVYETTEELISRAFNEVVNAGKIEGMFVKGEAE